MTTAQAISWGHELWDQYPALSDHTHRGIEFLDKYGQFMKERCAIEVEYAGKLRRLAKHHQLKRKDDEDNQYSYCKAFLQMLQEVTDLAGQHEVIAETITANIVKEITLQLKELKEERKRHLHEGQRHMTAYSASLNQLDKAKKAYEKAFKEAEKAREAYEKADADLNLSRAEVEKAKNYSLMKGQICEDCKNEYANQLQKTNELQRRHFNDLMPGVFAALQEMEERRISCLQSYIKQSALIHRQVSPIIDKCLEGIIRASESVNPSEDSLLVVERFKSGNYPPEDIPFEDLSNPTPHPQGGHVMTNGGGGSTSSSSTTSSDHHTMVNGKHGNSPGNGNNTNGLNYSHSLKSETLRGTISMARLRKRGGLLGIFGSSKGMNIDDKNSDDYGDLPPVQRRKKIVQKIDQINASIQQELAVREGLNKMKAAYEANPSMGDPHSVEGQMADNVIKLEKLEKELKKFQGYLEEVDSNSSGGKPGTPFSQKKVLSPTNHSGNGPTTNNRTFSSQTTTNRISTDQDSLSRSASDSSFSQQGGNVVSQPSRLSSSSAQKQNTSSIVSPNVQSSSSSKPTSSAITTTITTSPSTVKSISSNLIKNTSIISQTSHTTITTTSASQVNKSSVSPSSLTHKTNGSPNSNNSPSHLSIPDADYVDASGDMDEFDELPVLEKARALYSFEAQSEGAISMEEGEELEVVELDQGDGWTRVRKTKTPDDTVDEGFVPTSYLDIELDANTT